MQEQVAVVVDQQYPPLTASQKVVSLLPIGILGLAIATIVTAYKATFMAGVLDYQGGRVTTPPISMLMYKGPGRIVGQVGFPSISLLFGSIAPTFFRGLHRAMETSTSSKKHPVILFGLKTTAIFAFAALAVVGILPLQDDLEDVMRGRVRIRWDSIVHQSAAGVFFLCGIVHMGLYLYMSRFACDPSLVIHYKQSPKSFVLKLCCFVLCFVPLPTAFLLHPISPLRDKLQLTKADAGGITQYALVACVSTFFASYSCDLWQLQQRYPEGRELQSNGPDSGKKRE